MDREGIRMKETRKGNSTHHDICLLGIHRSDNCADSGGLANLLEPAKQFAVALRFRKTDIDELQHIHLLFLLQLRHNLGNVGIHDAVQQIQHVRRVFRLHSTAASASYHATHVTDIPLYGRHLGSNAHFTLE